ncbi:MAG: poly(R)-hydroxyalkanoic acid synthase subunit PhaE [Tepidiformaceae bacterium]
MADQSPTALDPFALWRDWVSSSEQQWNTFLNDALATDQFSQSMGRFMDVYLNAQKTMSDTMGRYLTAMNLPSRADVLTLGDRLSNIEERLALFEGKLDGLRAGGGAAPKSPAQASRPRPARTKKPAPKA